MSETKFTKGEWVSIKCIDECAELYFTIESKLPCGESRYICDTAESSASEDDEAAPSIDECKANYSLIAVAPDMYDFIDSLQLSAADDARREELLAKARGESNG